MRDERERKKERERWRESALERERERERERESDGTRRARRGPSESSTLGRGARAAAIGLAGSERGPRRPAAAGACCRSESPCKHSDGTLATLAPRAVPGAADGPRQAHVDTLPRACRHSAPGQCPGRRVPGPGRRRCPPPAAGRRRAPGVTRTVWLKSR